MSTTQPSSGRRTRIAREPAKQLNSRSIKDSARCYILPIVRRGFPIIKAKCVWRVAGRAECLCQAWDMVCEKGTECDKAVTGVRNEPNAIKRLLVFALYTTERWRTARQDFLKKS